MEGLSGQRSRKTQQWLREEGLGGRGKQAGRRMASTPQLCRDSALAKGTQQRNSLMLCRYNCPMKMLPTPSPLPLSGPRSPAHVAYYLVVGADVQQDRKALLRVDSSTRCVQGQLAHRDAHAVAAQVS